MKILVLLAVALVGSGCAQKHGRPWYPNAHTPDGKKCEPFTYGCTWTDTDNCNLCSCSGEGAEGSSCTYFGCTLMACGVGELQ